MNEQTINSPSQKSGGDDPAVTTLLRQTYSAPTDAAYWANLEQRVMTRLRESGPIAWWAVFSRMAFGWNGCCSNCTDHCRRGGCSRAAADCQHA